ncbi:hypothetical protein L7F22_066907 [Adiantum nelumboides]|nr:hypothetical protein [Adiantum nelumboides]
MFHFQIVHVEGKKNVVADALSRKPQISAVSIPYHHELDDMREQYANDEDFARVFEQLIDGQRHEHYLLKDGFMMMHGRLCVTRPLRRKVTEESHVPPYAGHRDKPWESIAMDFIFDLPRTQTGNDGIWTIICRFSKQAHFILVRKKIKPDQMARLFMSNIFKYHGMPQSIVSDRDPRMTSLFWRGLFENMGTTLKFSLSFHPQTDGLSEEANSTVLDLLKCYVSEHKGKWEQYLPLVEYAYNNTVHSSTGKASFEIVESGKKVPPILHTKDKIFEADKYVQDMDEMYKKVITMKELRERHLGKLQGLSRKDARLLEPEAYKVFMSHCGDEPIPGGGESLTELRKRSILSLEKISEKHLGRERVVVVTHGGVLHALHHHVTGKPPPGKVLNTSINVFEISNRKVWTLQSWGDVSHLTGRIQAKVFADQDSA